MKTKKATLRAAYFGITTTIRLNAEVFDRLFDKGEEIAYERIVNDVANSRIYGKAKFLTPSQCRRIDTFFAPDDRNYFAYVEIQ